MARNVAFFPVSIDRVFAVLSDPSSYAYWVVGSHSIRDADADWPAVGAKLHHRVGAGPLTLSDNTEVVDMRAPTHLTLQARARPLGTARVTLELLTQHEGTQVTMVEEPGDAFSRLLHNPLTDLLLRRRNDEALRRLGELAAAEPGAPRSRAA